MIYNGTLESMAERLNINDAVSAWVEDGALFMAYHHCYCSMVKKIAEILPRSWCYCGVGYTKRNIEYALGCEVDVELLESVKHGDERCLLKVAKISG